MRENGATVGADCHADADLAGALGHGNQHDIHDADAAHQQRYGGDGSEHDGHDLGCPGGHGGERCKVAHCEVVFRTVGNAMALPQQFVHLGLGFIHGFRRVCLRHQEADGAGELGAENLALSGGDGNEDCVVLVAAVEALPLGGEHARNDERTVPEAHSFSGRVILVKQVFRGQFSEERDARARAHLHLGEQRPAFRSPVAYRKIVGGDAGHHSAPVVRTMIQLGRARYERCSCLDRGQLRDGMRVAHRQGLRGSCT